MYVIVVVCLLSVIASCGFDFAFVALAERFGRKSSILYLVGH